MFSGPLGGRVRLEPGDVIVIAAEQVHQCNPDDGSWLYQMIHMDQNWAASLATTDGVAALFSGVTVLRRPDLHHRATAWSELIFSGATAHRIESRFRELVDELGAATPEHLVTGDFSSQRSLAAWLPCCGGFVKMRPIPGSMSWPRPSASRSIN